MLESHPAREKSSAKSTRIAHHLFIVLIVSKNWSMIQLTAEAKVLLQTTIFRFTENLKNEVAQFFSLDKVYQQHAELHDSLNHSNGVDVNFCLYLEC